MKSFLSRIFQLPVYVHLLAVMVVFVVAVYITLKSIDVYTNHNQAVIVPDVMGLQVEDAAPFLEQRMLRYEVIDSIYSKADLPGAIVALTPEANARVKQKRIISITINAKTEETSSIPDLTDISFRQAYAQLKARGFKNVESKYITGQHPDLIIGIEYEGQIVEPGARIPLDANLILLITDGNTVPLDSISLEGDIPNIGDENWF
jgi:beta-lactam-binding protein with PASTA domain